LKQNGKWAAISEKLNEEAKLEQLFDALLDEEKPRVRTARIDAEKFHWWKFLASKVARIRDVYKFISMVKKIRSQSKSKQEREVRYCELLRVPTRRLQIIEDKLRKQLTDAGLETPFEKPLDSYTVRWVYTYQKKNETLEGPTTERVGNKLKTLRTYKKEGKLKVDELEKLYKRACFIKEHLASGDCDEYSNELLEVSLSKLDPPSSAF